MEGAYLQGGLRVFLELLETISLTLGVLLASAAVVNGVHARFNRLEEKLTLFVYRLESLEKEIESIKSDT